MKITRYSFITTVVLLLSTAATAVEPIRVVLEFVPDIDNGRRTFDICARCHLPEAWGNNDGTYPQLAGQHVNVLQHLMGFLKNHISSEDKQELTETIDNYRLGQLPLIVPITLLRHHFRRHPHDFVAKTRYLEPHPAELMLLNSL